MKRKKAEREAKQNLDPFLDIITNVIGLLVIFAALVGLSVGGLETALAFPVLRDTPEETQFVNICCFESRVAPLNHTEIYEQQMERDSARKFGNSSTWGEWAAFCEQRDYHDDYMEVDGIELSDTTVQIRYQIRPDGLAETFQEICKDDSRFEKLLETKDPERDVIYFYVDKERFSAFRRARQHARAKGFRTGWEPFAISKIYMTVFGESVSRKRRIND